MVKNIKWDKLGIFLSSLCMVHCLVLPILAISVQSLSHLLSGDQIFHEIIFSLVIVTAFLAFVPGYRCHKNKKVFSLAIAGIGCLSLAHIVAEYAPGPADFAITLVGSGTLLFAHYKNLKLQKATCYHDHH